MPKNFFVHNVRMVPLNIPNGEQQSFRDELTNIPYLLYEVENLSTGEKILINKPGGKRSFGRLAKNDFMVFIFYPSQNELWLISHNEILEDLKKKFQTNPSETTNLIYGLLEVCNGEEPDIVLSKRLFLEMEGLSAETLLKVYKWIWGQEDCNYPNAEGRWLSMNHILKEFGLEGENA